MRSAAIVGFTVLLIATVVAATADLKPVVGPYLEIQRALNADSLDGVKDAAGRVAAAAASLEPAGAAIEAAAAELQQAGDLRAARAAFGRVGDAIIVYAKESGDSLGDGVKAAYCPMARKYWLQKGEEIQNPFYGKQMSDCGRIVAELPDLKK